MKKLISIFTLALLLVACKERQPVQKEIYSAEVTTPGTGQISKMNDHYYKKIQCADGLYCWRHIEDCKTCKSE